MPEKGDKPLTSFLPTVFLFIAKFLFNYDYGEKILFPLALYSEVGAPPLMSLSLAWAF
jgi:hypothetical protein